MSRVLVAILVLLLAALPASAREEILRYESTIEVQKDASLIVTEQITVRAEGRKIRRGIYRDFPVRVAEPGGLWRYVGFKVLEVTRNGQPEPFFTKGMGRFERVYIGDKNVFVQRGLHTYSLKYRTTRQLRYFEDYDELYWNVTGNFWQFPIKTAIAHVVLPQGGEVSNWAGYTGRHGATESAVREVRRGFGEITMETTRSLSYNEGMTVAVAFPKGVISEPSFLQQWLWKVWDNLGFAFLFGGFAVTAWFFITRWARYGRDPARGIVIPLFEPPNGLSPAAVSYVHFQKFKGAGGGATKPFIAALMSLAAKGWVNIIEDDDGDITLKRADEGKGKLHSGEQSIYNDLVRGREKLEFKKKNGPKIQSARSRFRNAIQKEHNNVFFKNNYGIAAIGAGIAILTLLAFVIIQQPDEDLVGMLVFTFIFSAAGSVLLSMGLRRLLNWIPGGSSKIWGVILTVLGGIITLPVLIMPLAGGGLLPILAAYVVAGIPAIVVSFFHLMRAPTPLGREVMDKIDGFKLYLSVAEAERMNMHGAPDMSQEIFEAYLPYAIALEVEKPWARAFESWLAKTVPDEARRSAYHPRWYHGSNWDSSAIGAATAGMVTAVSASMASAMPAPKSSSGSGGGGFSGGGGGGGGGGGW